ncbi:MAG: hypothetical protein OXH31_01700 [Gammaproteobacteria bacterium]|nr:hypothetical protein [Gammaproteobacteria bacterium]
MKKLNTWKLAILSILACLGVGIATFLFAQEDNTEEQGCKWKLEHLSTSLDLSKNYVASPKIFTLLLNECTGDLYDLRYGKAENKSRLYALEVVKSHTLLKE